VTRNGSPIRSNWKAASPSCSSWCSRSKERTADLREANDEIQRFAYIVSHDLRSPLVNIMGFTSELEELRGDIFRRIAALARAIPRRWSRPAPAIRRAAARRRRQAALAGFHRGARLHQIVDRQDGPPDHGDPQPHPRGTARIRAGEDRHPRTDRRHRGDGGASGRRAEAQIRIEPLPDIVSDRLAMEQIFSNLIDNALKYLKPGVPGDIAIRGRTKLGFAIFEIADNGRGIDPKDHQRIFDLFRRAGTQDKPGQGIGLAHVRALVRRLGGTMSVHRNFTGQHIHDNTADRVGGQQPEQRHMSKTQSPSS
jgi:signal transduction histidine kinase